MWDLNKSRCCWGFKSSYSNCHLHALSMPQQLGTKNHSKAWGNWGMLPHAWQSERKQCCCCWLIDKLWFIEHFGGSCCDLCCLPAMGGCFAASLTGQRPGKGCSFTVHSLDSCCPCTSWVHLLQPLQDDRRECSAALAPLSVHSGVQPRTWGEQT